MNFFFMTSSWLNNVDSKGVDSDVMNFFLMTSSWLRDGQRGQQGLESDVMDIFIMTSSWLNNVESRE